MCVIIYANLIDCHTWIQRESKGSCMREPSPGPGSSSSRSDSGALPPPGDMILSGEITYHDTVYESADGAGEIALNPGVLRRG